MSPCKLASASKEASYFAPWKLAIPMVGAIQAPHERSRIFRWPIFRNNDSLVSLLRLRERHARRSLGAMQFSATETWGLRD